VLRGHDSAVYSAAWSPDGKRIVSASADKTMRVWNADGTGQPLVLRSRECDVSSAVWSPDGARILSGCLNKALLVWPADGTGEPLVLRGHEAAAFVWGQHVWSPDGTRFVSSSNDGTARIWNADGTGEPILLRKSGANVLTASWSPDGKSIVAAGGDTTVLVFRDLEPLRGAGDPRLWTATRYCMPLETRRRLLGFLEAQSRADLAACERRVAEAAAHP
jgi:WD40 repeat protein